MTPTDIRTLRIERGYPTASAAGKAYAESFGGEVANCVRTWQRWEAGVHKISRHAENWLSGK